MPRPRILLATLATLSLLVAAAPSPAEEPTPPSSGEDRAAEPSDEDPAARREAVLQELRRKQEAKHMERWDADHNGVLDEEERAAEEKARKKAIEAARERRLARDPELGKKRQALLEKYDQDGDGRLSGEERARLRADRDAERAAGKAPPGQPR